LKAKFKTRVIQNQTLDCPIRSGNDAAGEGSLGAIFWTLKEILSMLQYFSFIRGKLTAVLPAGLIGKPGWAHLFLFPFF